MVLFDFLSDKKCNYIKKAYDITAKYIDKHRIYTIIDIRGYKNV